LTLARALQDIAGRVGIGLIFKASYDKANRTSVNSYRGPGLDEGLAILQAVKDETGLPVLSDVHDISQVKPAAEVLDVMQIPAFLSRQTDLLVAVGETGRIVNIKKGQFQAPWDMENAIGKVLSTGNDQVLLTERGASFGYNNLVTDMRSLVIMRQTGYPVVFDATHSVQLPGGAGSQSSGQREFVAPLSRAAVATGVDALFWEVHENPAKALCDGPNSLHLDAVEGLLRQMLALDEIVR
jgi:2-dehydro-3-deoxyphosphooctonate aldolase (KDO 8-P synthase)